MRKVSARFMELPWQGRLVAVLGAVALAQAVLWRTPLGDLRSAWILPATLVLAMAFVPLLARLPGLRESSPARTVAILGFWTLLGLLASLSLGTDPAPEPRAHATVEVSVPGRADPAAQGTEVWVTFEVDGRPAEGPVDLEGAWLERDRALVSSGPARLVREIASRGGARVAFVMHPWSGHADVTVREGGEEKRWSLNLYDPVGRTHLIEVAPPPPPGPAARLLLAWLRFCDALCIGLALWAAASLLQRIATPAAGVARVGERGWQAAGETLLYALPTMASSMFLLLAFHPGIMTTDSLNQWHQAGAGAYVDAHPVAYALFIAALRGLVDSPASVALAQAVLLALAVGWLVRTLRHAVSAPWWAAAIAAVLPAIYPLTAVTSITLWKDVPYAASVVGLTAFAIARTRGPAGPWSWLLFVALLWSCMSLRHNGIPVAIVAALVVAVASRPARRGALLSLAAASMAFVLFKGPVHDALDVQAGNVSPGLTGHHLAAHASQGNLPDDARDRALVQSINPDTWVYDCSITNPTVMDEDFNLQVAAAHTWDVVRIVAELAVERPDIQIGHALCASSMIWQMAPRRYLYAFPFHPHDGKVSWILPAPDSPVESSRAPRLAQAMGQVLLEHAGSRAWRPAAFLYVILFLGWTAYRRCRAPAALMVPALALAHTLPLAAVMVAQDARYQLPVYYLCLASAPLLLFCARASGARSGDPAIEAPEAEHAQRPKRLRSRDTAIDSL